MSEWVKCADHLPEDNTMHSIRYDDGSIAISKYTNKAFYDFTGREVMPFQNDIIEWKAFPKEH